MSLVRVIGSAQTVNARKVGEVVMKDPYEKAWNSIGKALTAHGEMVLWIAERTLSAKEFTEFVNEFAKKQDNHDEILDILREKGR